MGTRKRQQGFTLIELVIVVVILSILATIAIGKHFEVLNEIKRASAQGIAASLGSASMANYVIRTGIGSAKTSAVSNCTDVAALLQSGSMSGFAIAAQPVAPDQVVTCTVDHVAPGSSTAATFLAHGVS